MANVVLSNDALARQERGEDIGEPIRISLLHIDEEGATIEAHREMWLYIFDALIDAQTLKNERADMYDVTLRALKLVMTRGESDGTE
jgi:hypothetical protein